MSITISDSGKGIADDELNKVFEKYLQTRTGIESEQGTGLGLSISREFARLMAGDLTVESKAGSGSDFIFTFKAEEIVATSKQKSQKVIGFQGSQKEYRLLVVDDNELNREVLASLLRMVGFIVELAESGQESIELCQAFQPHLIFMDQYMPGLKGSEATKIIKDENPEIIVITLTASSLKEDEADCLEAGTDKIMAKPFKEEDIFSALQGFLQLEYVYAKNNEETNVSSSVSTPIESKNTAVKLHEQQVVETKIDNNKLIIVDDNAINLIIAETQLTDLGFEVVTASSAEEALKLFEQQTFDLVVTDCEMPNIDGFELTKKLLELSPNLNIIGYTAGKEEKLNQCLDAGMKDVLSKPLDAQEVAKILKPLVHK
jgi:CheY-like chemotaxis protein